MIHGALFRWRHTSPAGLFVGDDYGIVRAMKIIARSTLALCASTTLLACGGGASSGADPATPATTTAVPSDPSKPVAPAAVNAGKGVTNALVDDMDDGDHKSVEADLRGGYWYTYKDASSKVEPEGEFKMTEGGAGASSHAAGFQGELGSEQYPYVGMGVSFTDPKQPYDASSCQGVAFTARGGEGTTNIRVKVGDWQTVPEGGLCQNCYNDFGGDFLLTSTFQDFTLKFADMKQEPYWGEPKAAIDPTALYQLQWQVSKASGPFEVVVDNVRFVGCTGAEEIVVPAEPTTTEGAEPGAPAATEEAAPEAAAP